MGYAAPQRQDVKVVRSLIHNGKPAQKDCVWFIFKVKAYGKEYSRAIILNTKGATEKQEADFKQEFANEFFTAVLKEVN